ncbi:MAG: M50 family metallopeptidase [Planctomycetales bacterium]|nr:M50 family metallopeptidase [Planctomycetales bacterium]
MNLPQRIDFIINAFKWPAAFIALLATPLVCWSLIPLAARVAQSPWPLVPFAAGAAAFLIIWRRWLGKSRLGQFAITLEHESTHALFAALCCHRIVGFRATLESGGEVRYVGQGNWLITAAPYFFPTAALILFLLAYLLPFPGLPWRSFLLGVALAYHFVSTYRETHRDQLDLKQLGSLFCWMFLPAANLAAVGLLVSFAHDGTSGMSTWFSETARPIYWLSEELHSLTAEQTSSESEPHGPHGGANVESTYQN